MRRRHVIFAFLILLLVVVITLGIVRAAANTVRPSGLTNQSSNATANQLKPSECDSLNLTNILFVTPGVPLTSTGNSNDLILGTSGADTISAGRGTDCILGGGGNDDIISNQNNDVILGGSGNDDLDGGAGTGDICYGGTGTDTFSRCETTNDP